MIKHQEFYKKYKVNDVSANWQLKEAWWKILAMVAAILVESFAVYKRHKAMVPFSVRYYGHVVEIFVMVTMVFALIVIIFSWRELITQNRGYGWIGTFSIEGKYASFLFYRLVLRPGNGNIIRVNKDFFEKIRVGDTIEIKRDALGKIDSVKRTGSFATRLRKLTLQ